MTKRTKRSSETSLKSILVATVFFSMANPAFAIYNTCDEGPLPFAVNPPGPQATAFGEALTDPWEYETEAVIDSVFYGRDIDGIQDGPDGGELQKPPQYHAYILVYLNGSWPVDRFVMIKYDVYIDGPEISSSDYCESGYVEYEGP